MRRVGSGDRPDGSGRAPSFRLLLLGHLRAGRDPPGGCRLEMAELHPVRCEHGPECVAVIIGKQDCAPREMTAMTRSLLRADEKVPEKRRPSCLSIVRVKGRLRSCGSFDWVGRWCVLPPSRTIDSLSPFQMPRTSGIAVCAAEGAAASVASVTIQANFDIAGLLLQNDWTAPSQSLRYCHHARKSATSAHNGPRSCAGLRLPDKARRKRA